MSKVQPKALLAVENALTELLVRAWDRQARKWLRGLERKVKEGDFAGARRDAHDINLKPVYEDNEDHIRILTHAAFRFGATRLGRVDHLKSDPAEDKYVKSSLSLLKSMILRCEKWATQAALAAIDELEAGRAEVSKAELVRPFTSFLSKNVAGASLSSLELTASLHSSRLAVYGFSVEATLRGEEFYVINAVLDNRTSQVCRIMHGKTFPVRTALEKSRGLLTLTDVNDIKSAAPWPKSDKASLARLEGMSTQELIAAGWSHPPYHPMCRTYIDAAGSVTPLPEADTTAEERGQQYDITSVPPETPVEVGAGAQRLLDTLGASLDTTTATVVGLGAALALASSSGRASEIASDGNITATILPLFTENDLNTVRNALLAGTPELEIIFSMGISAEQLANIKAVLHALGEI